MSICVNAQMCSYVRTLFEHPSKWYESYQENGTKYLKSRKKLEEELQQHLNACAGEIFLCGIPADIQAEKIAEVASLLGEVYILRFKVHFSGASRGFAYLQYIDPNLMHLALEKLPHLFRTLHMPMIKVCASRNSSTLLLRKVSFDKTPKMVCDALRLLIDFQKLEGYELSPGYFEYQIAFKCNEEAVHARRNILKSILKFGPKAVVVWDASGRSNENVKGKFNKNFYIRQQQYEMRSVVANNSHQNYIVQQNNSSHSYNNFVNEFSNMKFV